MTEPSGVLEPRLTAFDKRVLAAVPSLYDADGKPQSGHSIWTIGRELQELDLNGLLDILRGLQHFGLVTRAWRGQRKPDCWQRTAKGDEALT